MQKNEIPGTSAVASLHMRANHVSLKNLYNKEFYGDLVYKFKKFIGNPNFSNIFKCTYVNLEIVGFEA